MVSWCRGVVVSWCRGVVVSQARTAFSQPTKSSALVANSIRTSSVTRTVGREDIRIGHSRHNNTSVPQSREPRSALPATSARGEVGWSSDAWVYAQRWVRMGWGPEGATERSSRGSRHPQPLRRPWTAGRRCRSGWRGYRLGKVVAPRCSGRARTSRPRPPAPTTAPFSPCSSVSVLLRRKLCRFQDRHGVYKGSRIL